ncbi:lasso peptide biosynthesis B2 protein [Sphingomonas sp. QA11]|uniref:lasso peptide biosynthesis B2 protein n=1 Tax=Sphingomonas sp. QA11 TaxID=2950605 RepID=UPI00234AD5F6|nr:lasso peptide biosynthesis B2 protein [Sphingomonas sp. QA11]WCM25932.1 lasso peptide biosynthesis B2 protein [Sphingomonas sp. QA11]
MPYRLRTGLSYCWSGDQAIFLDIDADRYFRLGQGAERLISTLEATDAVGSTADEALLLRFIESGFLVESDVGEIAPCNAIRARVSALDGVDPSLDGTRLPGLILELLAARTRLRFRSLSAILRDLRARQAPARKLSGAELHAIAHSFRTAGYVVGTLDQCLPRSIALMRYMVRVGASPSLVFAVMARPFAAHCWVQLDDVVLNDTIENVRQFTPIRVV